MIKQLLILGLIPLLFACQHKETIDKVAISFVEVDWYAQRAAMAYQSEAVIRKKYPNTVLVASTKDYDVQYFLEMDTEHQRQIISIRGTDNLLNIREDAEYVQSRNPKLGIYVHDGFDQGAYDIFNALKPHLNQSYSTIVTGHSLGAAIATILMMHLYEDGYTLGRSINFGQPKVTNREGAKKYKSLPLLRVADENDLVPLLPPTDFVDSIHGAYEHLGPELILLQGEYYVYQTHHQLDAHHADSFWDNLGDESVTAHYMKNYLHNIASKMKTSSAVSFDQRERYTKN